MTQTTNVDLLCCLDHIPTPWYLFWIFQPHDEKISINSTWIRKFQLFWLKFLEKVEKIISPILDIWALQPNRQKIHQWICFFDSLKCYILIQILLPSTYTIHATWWKEQSDTRIHLIMCLLVWYWTNCILNVSQIRPGVGLPNCASNTRQVHHACYSKATPLKIYFIGLLGVCCW